MRAGASTRMDAWASIEADRDGAGLGVCGGSMARATTAGCCEEKKALASERRNA